MGDNLGKNRKILSGAIAFITLMGIVSLFSDMTHEGARSILGEYLNLTGASAATIGFVSGIGELCGYSLRLLSGYVADKTKKYWTLIIAGYTMQVLAIPLLAFVPENGWLVACGLVIMERVGKAISTTGLAGGLLTPYKGSLPALESKDSSKSSPAAKHLPT